MWKDQHGLVWISPLCKPCGPKHGLIRHRDQLETGWMWRHPSLSKLKKHFFGSQLPKQNMNLLFHTAVKIQPVGMWYDSFFLFFLYPKRPWPVTRIPTWPQHVAMFAALTVGAWSVSTWLVTKKVEQPLGRWLWLDDGPVVHQPCQMVGLFWGDDCSKFLKLWSTVGL